MAIQADVVKDCPLLRVDRHGCQLRELFAFRLVPKKVDEGYLREPTTTTVSACEGIIHLLAKPLEFSNHCLASVVLEYFIHGALQV